MHSLRERPQLRHLYPRQQLCPYQSLCSPGEERRHSMLGYVLHMEHPEVLHCRMSGSYLVQVVRLLAIPVAPTASGPWLARGSSISGCWSPIGLSSLGEVAEEEHFHAEGKAAVGHASLVELGRASLCYGRSRELDEATGEHSDKGRTCPTEFLLTFVLFLLLVLVIVTVHHLLDLIFELLEERHSVGFEFHTQQLEAREEEPAKFYPAASTHSLEASSGSDSNSLPAVAHSSSCVKYYPC